VSTYDDRSRKQGAEDGLFYPNTGAGGSTYNSAGRDPSAASFDPDPDEEFGFTSGGATSVLPPGGSADFGTSPFDEDEDTRPAKRRARMHGGADFGLLILRIVVGGTFVVDGLRHLFGMLNGQGYHAFAAIVEGQGYRFPTVLAYLGGGVELVGGGLLVLGLFTPLAASALLALLANVITLKWRIGFSAPFGYELPLVLASATFALLFTGAGRVSLDRPTPWNRRPALSGFIFLVIGAAVAVVLLLVVRKH
jgi:putative oxidoreductase